MGVEEFAVGGLVRVREVPPSVTEAGKAVFWLLDIVVGHREPVETLLSNDPRGEDRYFGEMFNRGPHGLDREGVVAALTALAEEGLILAWRASSEEGFDVYAAHPGGFPPTRPQIEEALRRDRSKGIEGTRLYYGLSERGGQHWESLARPDWDRFVDRWEGEAGAFDESMPDDDPSADRRQRQMTSSNRLLLEEHLRRDQETYRIVDPETIRWETLTPWDATYWKRLPQAYRVTYSFWKEEDLTSHGAVVATYEEMERLPDHWGPDWYTDFITGEPAC